MLSQELQTPAQMTVWSEGAFSSARHKLHITANDDGDIVTDAHRRLPDHMIVATDSASIAPISLPIEHGFASFQTAQTEQAENADASAMQADLEQHAESEQHENTATHHDEQFHQHQVLQQQQQLAHDNHEEQQREQQPQQPQQQLPQPDHQEGQLQEQRQEQQQQQQQHEQQVHHAQQPEPQQSLQQQHFVRTDAAGSKNGVQRETPRRRPGSNRRKRYRCGYCHELGHNQKTCPLRPPHLPTSTSRSHAQRTSVPDTAQLRHVAAKVAEELSRMFFEMASAHSGDDWQPPQQISYDAVLEAANKEVTQANEAVADAKTDNEFDNALDHLQSAVCNMEKVAVLIYKSAALAHTLSRNVEDPS